MDLKAAVRMRCVFATVVGGERQAMAAVTHLLAAADLPSATRQLGLAMRLSGPVTGCGIIDRQRKAV